MFCSKSENFYRVYIYLICKFIAFKGPLKGPFKGPLFLKSQKYYYKKTIYSYSYNCAKHDINIDNIIITILTIRGYLKVKRISRNLFRTSSIETGCAPIKNPNTSLSTRRRGRVRRIGVTYKTAVRYVVKVGERSPM